MEQKLGRTSDTHPIRIDFVDFKWEGVPSKLGITFAPGKKQKNAWSGIWYRDLHKDLQRITKHYQIHTLVCLIEQKQMITLQIQNLIPECQKRGLKTYHFPIRDNNAPKNEQQFKKLVVQVVEGSLKKGNNVVVHCKGGLGRAPTFAIACLIYSGLKLDEALQILKQARKDCEPTNSQIIFLKSIDFKKM